LGDLAVGQPSGDTERDLLLAVGEPLRSLVGW
jgi:hypothetical protein